jgi:hypothetical protein
MIPHFVSPGSSILAASQGADGMRDAHRSVETCIS